MARNLAFYLFALGTFVPPAVVLLGAVSLLVPRRKRTGAAVTMHQVARA